MIEFIILYAILNVSHQPYSYFLLLNRWWTVVLRYLMGDQCHFFWWLFKL